METINKDLTEQEQNEQVQDLVMEAYESYLAGEKTYTNTEAKTIVNDLIESKISE